MHFGLRGRQEHVQMLWGDIELIIDNSGQEYLQFHERATKTRQGSSRETRAFLPKMFATGCTFQTFIYNMFNEVPSAINVLWVYYVCATKYIE